MNVTVAKMIVQDFHWRLFFACYSVYLNIQQQHRQDVRIIVYAETNDTFRYVQLLCLCSSYLKKKCLSPEMTISLKFSLNFTFTLKLSWISDLFANNVYCLSLWDYFCVLSLFFFSMPHSFKSNFLSNFLTYL